MVIVNTVVFVQSTLGLSQNETAMALAACAYRFDIKATVRARSIIEPWTISIATWGWAPLPWIIAASACA